MEFLEYMIIAPIAYLVFKGLVTMWNVDVIERHEKAKYKASCLLGEGKREEAKILMERANRDYKRSYMRKLEGSFYDIK